MSAFLRAGAGATFVWGEIDCSLFMADWCRKTRGVDPAASLRGRYRTALGAMRHVRRLGGFGGQRAGARLLTQVFSLGFQIVQALGLRRLLGAQKGGGEQGEHHPSRW